MLINLVILLVSLIFLVKGSTYFIKSAAILAKKFNVSQFVIGLTIVAVGTSLPELISSIIASVKGESALIIGTITGANIANMAMIVGIASFIGVIKTKKEMLYRDGYIMVASFILLILFTYDRTISLFEGIILVMVFITYILFLFDIKNKKKKIYGFSEFVPYFFTFKYISNIKSRILNHNHHKKNKHKKGIVKHLVIILIAGTVIVFSAKFLVEEAVYFANFFKFPKTLIGILIAIGTTMPELSVAIVAARKNLGNIVLGNAIGSCLTNTLLVIGVASIINPLTVPKISILYIMPFMVFLGFLLLLFIKTNWKIKRTEGIILLVLYLAFLMILLLGVVGL